MITPTDTEKMAQAIRALLDAVDDTQWEDATGLAIEALAAYDSSAQPASVTEELLDRAEDAYNNIAGDKYADMGRYERPINGQNPYLGDRDCLRAALEVILTAQPARVADVVIDAIRNSTHGPGVTLIFTSQEKADRWHSQMTEALQLQQNAAPHPSTKENVTGDALAKHLYSQWIDNQGIHCNRFPSWIELSEDRRNEWRAKAAPQPPAKESGE